VAGPVLADRAAPGLATSADPLGDQLTEQTDESGMDTDGPASDHVQTLRVAEKAGLVVKVV